MTSMRPAIVICVPCASPLWMTRVGASSPTSLNGTHVRPPIDTPPTDQTDIDHTDKPGRSAPPLTRIHAMNPARILAPGFLTQGCPDLVRIHASRQRIARGSPQRGEIEVGDIRAAEGRPEGRSYVSDLYLASLGATARDALAAGANPDEVWARLCEETGREDARWIHRIDPRERGR